MPVFDSLGLDELIPCCLCLTPYLLAGLVIVAIILFGRRRRPPDGSLPARSSSERELDHIDYALAQIEEAKEDSLVDERSYAGLRERLMARRQHVLGIRPAEAEPSAPEPPEAEPSAPAPSPREPLTLARVTRWLLYLGVFLLFIATIIFAVYKWESFPEWVKFAVLLAVTGLFYASGWYVRAKLKIGGGGLALIVVGAIMTFFDGYIYLSGRGLLDSSSAWAIVLIVLAVVYIVAALLTPSRLLLCFSNLAQAAAVVCLGRYYYLGAPGSQRATLSTFGTLLTLAILALVWLLVSAALEKEGARGRHFRVTLFASAHGLVALAAAVYLLLLLIITIASKFPGGSAGLPVDLLKTTRTVFTLQLAFDAVVAALFIVDWWRAKSADYLYAVAPALAAALLSCLLVTSQPARYFPLAFSLLALAWLLAAWMTKTTGALDFAEQQLLISSYVLAVLVGAGVLPYLVTAAVLANDLSAVMGSNTRLLTCLSLGAFFFLGALYQRSSYPIYPSAAFLALFYEFALARLKLEARYVPLAFIILALAWLIRSWWTKARDLSDFVHRPLAQFSYGIASLVGVYSVFAVVDAAESGAIRSAASVETILVFVLLAAFFGLAAGYWRWEGHAYPAIFSATVAYQLVFARTAMDLEYMGIVTALLGPVYLSGSLISHRYRLDQLAKPLLAGAYAVSLYSLLLAFVDQPTLIAVLLVNAALYVVLAFVTLAGSVGARYGPGRWVAGALGEPDADIAYLWLALLQLAAALLVALDYQQATHLQANIAYVSFYLGIFAVSLPLRQLELGVARRWSLHLFAFAALFCFGQLVVQTFASATTGPDILAFAYVIAGFFFVAAAQTYPYEILNYGGFLFFLAAYVVKLLDLDVAMIEWYSVPIALYILAMGYVYERAHPKQRVTAVSNPLGMLIMLGAPTLAFMGTAQAPTAQLHAIVAGVLSILFIAGGVVGRVKAFFFGGVLFLAWDALYQSWEFLYALPKWATIGTLGLLLLVVAIYLERRREQVLDLARRARETLAEDWR